jgi:hypothetical protein
VLEIVKAGFQAWYTMELLVLGSTALVGVLPFASCAKKNLKIFDVPLTIWPLNLVVEQPQWQSSRFGCHVR